MTRYVMSDSEWVWLISCGYNTPQEVKELKDQLQETTDESTMKQLQQEISITEAKGEVAAAKAVR